VSAIRHDSPITIRLAREEDGPALRRLGQLDGARLPAGPVLVAEVDGELRAALHVVDRVYIADPFSPSGDLVALLDVRARRLAREHLRPAERIRARVGVRRAVWAGASAGRAAL
jgi:hypothetical protein